MQKLINFDIRVPLFNYFDIWVINYIYTYIYNTRQKLDNNGLIINYTYTYIYNTYIHIFT